MRVWLPLFPKLGERSHSFMARRIMLHFPCHNIYPLRILFERALMLGVANETQIYPETSDDSPTDRKSTRLNSSHSQQSRMPSSA